MVKIIDRLEATHREYVEWLRSQPTPDSLAPYIEYAEAKLANYDKCRESREVYFVTEMPRGMNRYLDQFWFDAEFRRGSNRYIDRMLELVDELRDAAA